MTDALRRFGRRLWPKRLAGQLIALLLLALAISQIVTLAILLDERRSAVRAAERVQVLSRTASIVRLLATTPQDLHEPILRTASSPRLRFWTGDAPAVDDAATDRADRLERRLYQLLDGQAAAVMVEVRESSRLWGWQNGRADDDDDDDDDRGEAGEPERDHREGGSRRWHRHHPRNLIAAVSLADGRWLNVETRLPPPPPLVALPSLIGAGVMAVALSVIVVVMIRRMTRPMADLAEAAEALGRGEEVAAVPERGPEDVRRTTRAFNAMHQRLRRFVQDRTRMLAAISHDLRTPITSLRLRAEFVDDDETRARILETLDEMQRMTEAALAFAREEAAREDTRTVDLGALVESVAEDLAELGMAVSVADAPRTPYPCRPVGLKRTIRNLVENAVTYGQRARVALAAADDALTITIDDDGPGIPAEDAERVFAPFVRLEESRSGATGGIGLGMAIARSIVRGHGGDVTLANRPEGGLRVTIRLPCTPGG